jgi:hypothetical protein
MVGIDGACSTIIQAGHLNTITHMSILSALEHWANRFQKRGNLIESKAHLHSWMLDETGTINTGLIDHGEILQQEMINIRGVSEEKLEVQGVLPRRKEKGITWLL